MPSISVPLAFAAGILSFLSPCLLPLVPGYLSYLSGSSLSGDSVSSRWRVFSHALVFVLAFSLVFVVVFGLPASVLPGLLLRYSDLTAKIGGAILILFGLHTTRAISLPLLDRTFRLSAERSVNPGYIRSGVLGLTFALGWTPCIGPLLGAAITLALNEPSRGIVMVVAYALGLAIPFLLTALLTTQAVMWLRRVGRYMRVLELASGLMMILIGVLLVSGTFTTLNGLFIRLTPDWMLRYL